MRFRYTLLVLSLLFLSACATRERHLRSHPAVFAEPTDDFKVLVPFNRTTPPPPQDANKAPVRIASLNPVVGEPAEPRETLTRLLHEFRVREEAHAAVQAEGEKDVQLLERIAKGYSADVAAVRFRCVDVEHGDSAIRRLRSDNSKQDRCTYIAADLRDLMSIPSAAVQMPERNDIIAMLLNASDYNCSNFLVGAFAKKTNIDSTRNTLKDIGTGLAALAASPAPAISAGLGLTNLITGSAVDNYNASFYLEKTFQVMESAIGKERAVVRSRIATNMKKPSPEYTLYSALNDIRGYDDACSIERGLAVLSEMAAVQKNIAEEGLNKTANPEAEQTRELNALLSQLTRTIQQTANVQQNANDRQLIETLKRDAAAIEAALQRMSAPAVSPDAVPATPAPVPPPQP